MGIYAHFLNVLQYTKVFKLNKNENQIVGDAITFGRTGRPLFNYSFTTSTGTFRIMNISNCIKIASLIYSDLIYRDLFVDNEKEYE